MKRIGIFGTSGFAREVGDIAWELSYKPIYVARDKSEMAQWEYADDVVLESEVVKYQDISFAIGIGDNAIRQKLATRFAALTFANLLHPSATFGRGQLETLSCKRGVIIAAGVRFTNNIQIGNFTVFNLNATIGHDSIIDDFANIAPGACISGNVHVGERCWIGTGAAINQGDANVKLIVGKDTVIGSGSIVVRACEPHAVYVGIPAKRIK